MARLCDTAKHSSTREFQSSIVFSGCLPFTCFPVSMATTHSGANSNMAAKRHIGIAPWGRFSRHHHDIYQIICFRGRRTRFRHYFFHWTLKSRDKSNMAADMNCMSGKVSYLRTYLGVLYTKWHFKPLRIQLDNAVT